mgnify:FL=1
MNKKTCSKTGKKSKIDLIVPFEDELDYIKDYDGDYGLDKVRFRFEFEMSPDGKHIVRPVSEVNPYEINATYELLIREAKLLGREFGYSDAQIKILFKELFRAVFCWYVVTGYPLAHLRSLVKSGYFKHLEDVFEFIFITDDFADAEEVVTAFYTQLKENAKIEGDEELISAGEDEEDEYQEEEFMTEAEEDFSFITYYDKEKEYEIFERLSQIKKQLENETDPERREELIQEKKALVSRIYRMREEFLAEHGLTYLEFIMLRRQRQIEKSWGWVKYPMYGEEEEYDKWKMVEDMLLEKIQNIEITLNELKYVDDENIQEKIKELREKKKKLEKSLEKIRFKSMTPEERKIHEIHRLIDKIRRLGKDKNRLAYELTQTVKAKIKKVRGSENRKVLYKRLNEVWQLRKERFERLFNKNKTAQLSLF